MKQFLRSFAGGEITPEMFARLDTTKFQTGLALCRNFEIRAHGPAVNRPGTTYLNSTKNDGVAVLIPFIYSTTQSYVLEFGDFYVRFHTNGATVLSGGVPYEIVSPYAVADVAALNYAQSNDVLTITHPSYQPRELVRSGATSWAFNMVAVVPTQAAPTAIVVTPYAAGTTTYEYTVTAIGKDGLEESLAPTAVSNALCADLSGAGNSNKVTWTNAANAIRYNVYKTINGLQGYIGQSTDGTIGFIDNYILPNVAQTPPQSDDPISAAGDYPGAPGYHQGRRWFAGSNNEPSAIWASRSGTENNFTYSIPAQDSDAITARITARQADQIRHFIALQDLIILTSGGEWVIDGGGNAGPITGSNIAARLQGATGASLVKPVQIGNVVLYMADRGAHLQMISFAWQVQGYPSEDQSLMAAHLFDGYTIDSMAYVRGPHPTLWCVRSDGMLLGLTYIQIQEVAAWHQHNTQGLFQSVAVVPEGPDDVPYFIVQRTINGATKRFIERKQSRLFATLADSYIVDCGLIYNGAPATHFTGYNHLIGATVSILADGAVQPQQVVAPDGSITLAHAASKVMVGLQITADLQTLPLQAEIEAFAQGANKNINKVWVRVYQSGSLFVGPTFDKLTETKWRSTEPYGSAPAWRSTVIPVVIQPMWGIDGQLCIRNTDPLPLTVVGLVPDTAFGG